MLQPKSSTLARMEAMAVVLSTRSASQASTSTTGRCAQARWSTRSRGGATMAHGSENVVATEEGFGRGSLLGAPRRCRLAQARLLTSSTTEAATAERSTGWTVAKATESQGMPSLLCLFMVHHTLCGFDRLCGLVCQVQDAVRQSCGQGADAVHRADQGSWCFPHVCLSA